MKRILLLCTLFSLVFVSLNAQSQQDLLPCGSPSFKSKWLTEYQLDPSGYDTKDDEILRVPLTIHLLGTDAGTGYFSVNSLLDALCTLNNDFAETEIEFYIEGDINYIANSAWNAHESVLDGADMMFANNVENTINCYFVSDPAGNCGYNLPYAGMAMAKSCAAPADHTWAHEMGHGLSLPHPFLGWEGGHGYDGSAVTNWSEPAPDTVLYDYTFFQDVLYTDTLIVDTAVVERVDGSNCTFAADGFCDTAPDYIAYRWNCNSDDVSAATLHDPNDETFQVDGTLIMSYANDGCSYRFSAEQSAAMRANLVDEKPEVLTNQDPGPVLGTLELLSPVNEELQHYQNAVLDWADAENALGYTVQLEIFLGNSSVTLKRFETTESQIQLEDDLVIGSNYRWTVRTYNNYYFCEDEYSAQGLFTAAEISSTTNLAGLSGFSVFPNVQAAGAVEIRVRAELNEVQNLRWTLTDITGKTVTAGMYENAQSLQTRTRLGELHAGVYFFSLANETGKAVKKIVVR